MTDAAAARGDGLYRALLLGPALFLALFYAVPVANVLWLGLSHPQPGFGNYEGLFASEAVRGILATTARVCLVTTLLAVALGYALAYRIVRGGARESRLLLGAVLLTFWISALVRAFAWVALLQPNGPLRGLLTLLGGDGAPLRLIRNEVGVVIGMVHYMVPYAALVLVGTMRGIDPALTAAARSLGASPGQAFRRVFLPLSVPGIAAAFTLALIVSLGFYITPAILGGGKVVMVSEYIGLQMTETLRWGVAAALATLLLAVVAAVTAWAGRLGAPLAAPLAAKGG